MPLELGRGFQPRVVTYEVEPEPPTVEDLRSERLLLALSSLQDALNSMPAPVVHVAEPDLTAIVQAVTQLNGPATAQEIAEAVREAIDPSPQPTIEPVLEKLTDALERLDFRMRGMSANGGGGSSAVQNVTGTSLDTRDAQLDSQYEWQAIAAESVPLYIGTAAPGTQTSASTWRIEKYTFTTGPVGNAVPSVVQTAVGAWDSRASLF